MLGRKSYTADEVSHAEAAVEQLLGAYRTLAQASEQAADPRVAKALVDFEPILFNNMTLALDRYFVHRVRVVAGKDSNPLNEVELLAESLMDHDAFLRGNNVLKLVTEQSVLKLKIGDRIRLDVEQFEKLAKAFLADIKRKFK